MTDHPFLAIFSDLLDAPAPSGREEHIAGVIRDKLDAMSYAHETDPAGQVLVRLEGRDADAGAMVIAAHMDEIGLVVNGIEPDGALRVDRSGGLTPFKIGERPVTVVGDREPITGVLSFGSTHVAGAGSKQVTWSDFRVITGLTPDQLAEAGVRPGSTCVPTRDGRGPVLLGDPADPLVAAWTFDDRAGCATLLRLLEAMKEQRVAPARPSIIAFSVHEEGGCHGAKVLAHREQPEIFVGVDGCPITPGSDLKIDGRPGIWSKDVRVHYDQRLVQALCQAASAAGTELQPVVYDTAFSDAGAVYDTGGAPRVALVGHVRENSHGFEVARLSVFDNLLHTLLEFVARDPE